MKDFVTKDSWERKEFSNWFVRDTDNGKLRYDLIPLNMLERLAWLYTRWMEKYGANNRQQARGKEAIDRFKQSAFRHFMQWMNGEDDEDHGMAVVFNVMAYEWHELRELDMIFREPRTVEIHADWEPRRKSIPDTIRDLWPCAVAWDSLWPLNNDACHIKKSTNPWLCWQLGYYCWYSTCEVCVRPDWMQSNRCDCRSPKCEQCTQRFRSMEQDMRND